MNTTNKLNALFTLSEQFSEDLDNLKAFPYIYESLTAFGINTDHKELCTMVHSISKIEAVYLAYLEQTHETLVDQVIKLQKNVEEL